KPAGDCAGEPDSDLERDPGRRPDDRAGRAVRRPRLAWRRRVLLADDAADATFRTLHTASSAARDLREGLTAHRSQRAARHLRALLGTAAVAVVDPDRTLAWEGAGAHHAEQAVQHAQAALRTGHTAVLRRDALSCNDPDCPIACAVIAPLVTDGVVVGALAAYLP